MVYGGLGDCYQLMMYGIVFHPMGKADAVGICDHHKIPAVEVRVTNQEGRLICHVTGMGYRKNVMM